MSRWATCSRRPVLAAAVAAGALAPSGAGAQSLLTQEEALRLAFPEATSIERRTAFLSERERRRAAEQAGVEVAASVVTYYVGSRDATPLGVAYFEAHRVRTLPEVVMIVVTPDARVDRIEILRFSEPPQYRAPEGWLRQFRGRVLGQELSLKGEIVNITGATLTSNAITGAARRTLALHRVIDPLSRRATEGSK